MKKSISYSNAVLVYYTYGEGLPVMLLHGFAETNSIWKNQTTYLSNYCKLIIPDLPGSGKSQMPGTSSINNSIEEFANAVHAIIQNENLEQCIMIGHSMGGYITLAFAEKYPEKLKAFGLFHSTAYADSDEKKIARKKGIEFIEKHGSYEFIKQSVPNLFTEDFKMKYPEIVSELIERYNNFHPRSLVSYYNAMMNRPDRTHILKDLKKTVLFIIGEKDSAVSLEHSLQQSFLPELCYIHILENAAHMGMFEDKNHSNEFLNEFLKQAKK